MSDEMAYIGRLPCGCAVAVTCIGGGNLQVANDVADFIRSGYTVELVTVEWARQNVRRCKHEGKLPEQLTL